MKTQFKCIELSASMRKYFSGLFLLLVLIIVGCSNNDNGDSNNLSTVDIVIIVDNSGDMGEEIQGFRDNLNSEFAQVFEAANLDYRIILISKYGSLNDESVCIEAPLSGISDCSNPPIMPINSNHFYHYSVDISSTNSLCKILETLNTPDEFGLAANGWIDWLRVNSIKFFLELSTDGVNCFSGITFDDLNSAIGGTDVANTFNTALTNLSSTHFGTSANPSYRFYSLIGNPNKDLNNPEVPYTLSDPITTSECLTAINPGTGYQGLSILTNGVRFSLCEPNSYDLIFGVIAQDIITAASN